MLHLPENFETFEEVKKQSFLRIMKEEINDYKKKSFDTPDRILVGEDIVNDLIDDEFFINQVNKLHPQ